MFRLRNFNFELLSRGMDDGDLLSVQPRVTVTLYFVYNIWITHVFSCINICRVPRMLFEHPADRPSVQASSEGPGKC